MTEISNKVIPLQIFKIFFLNILFVFYFQIEERLNKPLSPGAELQGMGFCKSEIMILCYEKGRFLIIFNDAVSEI